MENVSELFPLHSNMKWLLPTLDSVLFFFPRNIWLHFTLSTVFNKGAVLYLMLCTLCTLTHSNLN
jgi:hypothetical protein